MYINVYRVWGHIHVYMCKSVCMCVKEREMSENREIWTMAVGLQALGSGLGLQGFLYIRA